MTTAAAVEVDRTIECICDAWVVDGDIFTITRDDKGNEVSHEGWQGNCEFHEQYPDVFYDRDQYESYMFRLQEQETEVEV